ncbi:DUF3842 family protein [Eubacteriales bacterium OttesenSCG-928-N13]|nr:DUF3842 family protein [Eubacteriales bacterium OttesenSCG-928-N13]
MEGTIAQMKIVVIDGQGGGVGKALVAELKRRMPNQRVLCVGTNAMATLAMIKAGADAGATGENAAIVNVASADLILGPIGIVLSNAMMGELTPAIADAVGRSEGTKLLIPVGKCHVKVAGACDIPLNTAIEEAVNMAQAHIEEREHN